jgi:ATP-dependent RNA helicase RhlB
MSDAHLTDVSFTNLHLPDTLARGIADAGFERCTPIQAQTLPRALAGMDVAGQAQTGTGKTAAFLVAMYAALLRREVPATRRINAPRALIIAPTRELAVQIHRDAEILGQYTGLTLGLAFGGVDYEKQRRELEAGVDILIGTPGRLIDFYKQHIYDLRSVQALVLDEADRMFDLGFIADIRYIMRRLPAPDERLNMLSASRFTSPRWTRSRDCWLGCCGRWTRTAPWSSSTPAAAPRSSRPCCVPTASMRRRSRGTCHSANACGCCATSTAAISRC